MNGVHCYKKKTQYYKVPGTLQEITSQEEATLVVHEGDFFIIIIFFNPPADG